MGKAVQMHGRDHRPSKYGGTQGSGGDPTEGMLYLPSASETDGQVLTRDSTAAYGLAWETPASSSSSVAMWPIEPQELVRPTIDLAQNGDNWFSVTNPTPDVYGAIKYESTSDGDHFIAAARVGPYGSRWTLGYVVELGPDCGKLTIQAWVGPESYSGWTNVPDGGMQSPYNASNTYTQFVDVVTIDCYAAGSSTIQNAGPSSSIDWRVMGADGTSLTSISGTNADTGAGVRDADGGSGVWWFRSYINGKNASSSAYRVTVRGLWVARMTHDGFLV